MARDQCRTGMFPYPSKAACEKANPDEPAKRCDNCRGFHPNGKAKGRKPRAGQRR